MSAGKKPWVPRVLKKRESEFNTAPAVAPKAEPVVPSFGGAADLDDLDEDKKPPAADLQDQSAKRMKTEAVEAPPAATKPNNVDEIIAAAPRLAQHIQSAAKFNKVAAMAYSLLEGGRVTSENSHAFMSVLNAAAADCTRVREKIYRVACVKLFGSAMKRAEIFSAAERETLKLWELRILKQAEIYTDDSFQFSRAVNTLRTYLVQLPCVYPSLEPAGASHLPEAERPKWVEAIFDCLESVMAHHKYLWAKTTCDMIIRAAIDRRQNFSEHGQRKLQEWNATCKGQKAQRMQQHAQMQNSDKTSYERKEAEWATAAISTAKKSGGDVGGGIDNWMAKQGNN